jgi:hypothetical protein
MTDYGLEQFCSAYDKERLQWPEAEANLATGLPAGYLRAVMGFAALAMEVQETGDCDLAALPLLAALLHDGSPNSSCCSHPDIGSAFWIMLHRHSWTQSRALRQTEFQTIGDARCGGLATLQPYAADAQAFELLLQGRMINASLRLLIGK